MLIERVLSVINLLTCGPETIESLYKKLRRDGFAVSQRTIYRDIEKIDKVLDRKKYRVVRLDGDFNKARWMIVNEQVGQAFHDELIFKTFLTQHLKPGWQRNWTGDALADLIASGVKISDADSKALMLELAQFSIQHSDFGEMDYTLGHYKLLRTVLWALANERVLKINLENGHLVEGIDLRPMKVLYHRGALHVIGWYSKDGEAELKEAELSRIRLIRKTNDRLHKKEEGRRLEFFLKSHFGLQAAADERMHTIRLQMDRSMAGILKQRTWHPGQSFSRKGDSWTMEFKSTINGELVGWILSMTDRVKVVAPAALKKTMAEHAKRVAALYREP